MEHVSKPLPKKQKFSNVANVRDPMCVFFLIYFTLFIDNFPKKIKDMFIDSGRINWLFNSVEISLVGNCVIE